MTNDCSNFESSKSMIFKTIIKNMAKKNSRSAIPGIFCSDCGAGF
jgi:hypothetical protein